ncbi:MAG: glycosyltransferase [Flavobacteriaceae bacterium]
MKLAILSPNAFENAETFIKNHIEHLPFEIVLIHGGGLPCHIDGIQPNKWNVWRYKISVALKKILRQPITTFQEVQLTSLLKKERVEMVFAEYLHVGAEAVSVCEQLNIPMVAIALGYEISRYNMLDKYKIKYKHLFEYAEHIVVVSEHMKANIFDIGCDANKVIYSPASPSKDFFQVVPHFTSQQIVAVGRFVDKKAPHITLLAFEKVLQQVPNAQLVMAGDGPLWPACKDLARVLQIDHAVRFVGRITPKEHRNLLQESIAFVQHSKVAENGDSEGTPVAILEASASGLPIVSTQHAGIPYIVQDNGTGFLVAENDAEAMAENMLTLLTNTILAKEMGQRGRRYVAEHFTLEQHIETLTGLLNRK